MRKSGVVCAAALTASMGSAENALPSESGTASNMRVDRLEAGLDNLIAPGTEIDRVATGFEFTEGPMWRRGRLWFSDLVGNKMYAVSPEGKVELLIDKAGGLQVVSPNTYKGSNAMVTDKAALC
jgi:gluconolactonase